MPTICCLAIGISDAPPLAYLPGAVNGAKRFADWAKARGAKTELLTDEREPVGFKAIEDALRRLLAGPDQVARLYVYFAGHGLAPDAAEDLWLLSEWRVDQRAVAVNAFRRKLERYGISQIAVVADACRSLPVDETTADLTRDPILGLGPYNSQSAAVDFLRASSSFQAAYMVGGANPDDDRCIFSGVLEEALSGACADAFDAQRGMVTSGSLKAFLEREVPIGAGRYNVVLHPNVVPGFISPNDVYLDAIPNPPPVLRSWPPGTAADQMGPNGSARRAGARGWSTHAGRVPHGASDSVDPDINIAGLDAAELATAVANRTAAFQAAYAAEDRPTHYESEAGFSLAGSSARSVFVELGAHATDDRGAIWWKVEGAGGGSLRPERGIPSLLVELETRNWIGAAVLPQFVGTFSIVNGGAASLIYRRVGAPQQESSLTEMAVAQLRAGALTPETAMDAAAWLRERKEDDPVRGVLAAYLYDGQADTESVWRTAFFLHAACVPIPFDIALLGRLRCRRDPERGVLAAIPAASRRAPRSRAEEQRDWVYGATPSVDAVPVAGRFPWLRQGWTLLEPGGDDPVLVGSGLAAVCPFVLGHPFTTLSPEGGPLLRAYLERF